MAILTICAACADWPRTVGPGPRQEFRADNSIIVVEFDNTYLVAMKDPTIHGNRIVGPDRMPKAPVRAIPLARVTRVKTRPGEFSRKLESLGFHVVAEEWLPAGWIAMSRGR